MWILALYGTNTINQLDDDGELSLQQLPPNPATNDDWIKINILGASPSYIDESATLQTPGGFLVEKPILRRSFKIQLEPILFPSGMDIIEVLKGLKLKREIYIYNVNYPVAIHKADHAVRVNFKTIVEDSYESGQKFVTLDVYKTKVE